MHRFSDWRDKRWSPLGEPALTRESEEHVSRLTELIERNRSLDIGDGAAGCIAGLLSVVGKSDSTIFLDTAVLCGEQIVRSWASVDAPLAGFAHGAALLQLWRETGRADFLAKAREVVHHQRGLFSSEVGNWPDLRPDIDSTRSPNSTRRWPWGGDPHWRSRRTLENSVEPFKETADHHASGSIDQTLADGRYSASGVDFALIADERGAGIDGGET